MQIEQDQIQDGATLVLATIGFSRQQDDAVQQVLRRDRSGVRWRMGTLAEADAWWASGARTDESLWSPSGQASGFGPQVTAARMDFTVPASRMQASSPT